MLTRRLPANAVQHSPNAREGRDYFYFALAIIFALVVSAVDIGLRDQAAPQASSQ
jgi:acid phosphatase family membrane protein YuiD